jgi:hypothetical protein
MNPRRFLFGAGVVLVTIGLLGLAGLLQRISTLAFFHPPYWINWVHLSLGVFVLVVATFGRARLQAGVVLLPAVIGTTIGVLGLLFGRLAASRFNLPELADPSDHIAHLTVGLLATWAWFKRPGRPARAAASRAGPAPT